MTGAKFGNGSIESPISINEDDSFFARVHLPLDGDRNWIVPLPRSSQKVMSRISASLTIPWNSYCRNESRLAWLHLPLSLSPSLNSRRSKYRDERAGSLFLPWYACVSKSRFLGRGWHEAGARNAEEKDETLLHIYRTALSKASANAKPKLRCKRPVRKKRISLIN